MLKSPPKRSKKSRDHHSVYVVYLRNPAGDGKAAEIEVRQLFELEDFEQSPAIERFRELSVPAQTA